MDQQQHDTDKAYAQGDLLSLKQVHDNPPEDEAERAVYNRGWKDEYQR